MVFVQLNVHYHFICEVNPSNSYKCFTTLIREIINKCASCSCGSSNLHFVFCLKCKPSPFNSLWITLYSGILYLLRKEIIKNRGQYWVLISFLCARYEKYGQFCFLDILVFIAGWPNGQRHCARLQFSSPGAGSKPTSYIFLYFFSFLLHITIFWRKILHQFCACLFFLCALHVI